MSNTLDEINKQIDKLFYAGKLNTPEHLGLEEKRAELFRAQQNTSTLDDFFGDGSADNTPECSFCSGQDGKLIVGVRDAYGPTHWHHAACKAQDDAKKGTPITPTWDEAMDAAR